MSSYEAMRELLAPLEIYRWENSFQGAELKSAGLALDTCQAQLDEIQREMNLMTAEGEGLEKIASLLVRRPPATTPQKLRRGLAALLRIQDGSFTLSAINDNLEGCGLVARAVELEEPGKIGIVFPEVAGTPADFNEASKIIEEIIPCHLEVVYLFWYIIWQELERSFTSWRKLEEAGLCWEELEGYVGQGADRLHKLSCNQKI